MTVNKQPHHGYKTGGPIRTNLGRVLEPAPQATTEDAPTEVWLCARRLHISTLPAVVCVRCRASGASLGDLGMERFVKA